MLDSFSLSTAIVTLIVTFLVVQVAKLIIIPYFRMRSYEREDTVSYYFPLFGAFKIWMDDFNRTGDLKASPKEFKNKHPNARIWLSVLGTKPYISLRDPQYVKEFVQKTSSYEKTKAGDIVKFATGNGLVFVEGETWKRHRKIISGSFNYDFLKDNVGAIRDTAVEFFNQMSDDNLTDYNVLFKIQEITGEIVGRIFFGKKLANYTVDGKLLTTELAEFASELGQLCRDPLGLMLGTNIFKLPVPKYQRIKRRVVRFREICYQIIKDRKAQPVHEKDLLSSLLKTQSSENPELRFSDEDIVDEFATFFVAGMDTTAHVIDMIFYNLCQHPQYRPSLEKEIAEIYNASETKTTEMLQKMDVLHSMMKETLRMYSPAPFIALRNATEDNKILDLNIKKGDHVDADLFAIFFDEKIFTNPTEFNPERWRDPNFKYDPYAFVPFSAGARNCIGQHLAVIEAKVIISEFMNRFDFKMKDGYKLKMTFRLVYEPEEHILLDLTRRGNLKVSE